MGSVSTIPLNDKGSKGRLFIQKVFTDPDCGPDTVEATNGTGWMSHGPHVCHASAHPGMNYNSPQFIFYI